MNLTQLKTSILRQGGASDDATAVATVTEWINKRQRMLCEYFPFWFLDIYPSAQTSLIPVIEKCTVINSSPTVTGVGTNWLTTAQIGDKFWTTAGAVYTVLAVPADTTITLTTPYAGPTVSSPSTIDCSLTRNDGWLYQGWLVITPGQSEYPVHGDVLANKEFIQKIRWAKKYDPTLGTYSDELAIGAEQNFFSDSSYFATGDPTKVIFYDNANGTLLRFAPIPTTPTLVAIAMVKKNLLDLDPASNPTNYLTVTYPHILIDGALAELFNWSGETAKEQAHEAKFQAALQQLRMHYQQKTTGDIELLVPKTGARGIANA